MEAVGLVREGELLVRFNQLQLEGHVELLDVRMMAVATTEPYQHVVAVLGEEEVGGAGYRFRLYDSGGESRKNAWQREAGVHCEVLASQARCIMYAVVEQGSVLHERARANVWPRKVRRGSEVDA